MKKLLLLAAVAVLSFGVQSAQASTVNFGDSTIHWSGWNSTIPSQNSDDVLYTPEFTGGNATFNDSNGYLTTLSFYAAHTNNTDPFLVLTSGDLFINVLTGSNDTTWDYVVHSYLTGKNGSDAIVPLYDITSLGISATAPSILPNIRGKEYEAYIMGTSRENQPVALTNASLSNLQPIANVTFSGLDYITTYDFGTIGLNTGNSFIFSWTQNCGNEIVMEKLPVPEPSTILLLGAGLLGLSITARRKISK